MDKNLKEELDRFIEEFKNVPEVKQYLLLKKEIESSEELKRLSAELKSSQKAMALALGTAAYEEKKKAYFAAKTTYESHPLVVNYNVALEEVSYLLKELENKMK